MENVSGLFWQAAAVLYPLTDPVDYEPETSATIGAWPPLRARSRSSTCTTS